MIGMFVICVCTLSCARYSVLSLDKTNDMSICLSTCTITGI